MNKMTDAKAVEVLDRLALGADEPDVHAALARAIARLREPAEAQVPSYDALLIIAQSVCGALERAGITDCDDPGEAIDVLRERYEAQAQGGGEVRHDVEDVLCRAAALAERINYSADHDEAVNVSAELRRLLQKALSVRSGLSLFRHPKWGVTAPPSAPVGVEEMQRRLDREESDHGRTIDQRDAAEDALGRMFQAVTGRVAEWSSAWGYTDAIEEVEEHVAALAQQPAPVAPVRVGAAGLRRCGRCKREGDSPDCTRCGGTGWRRKCDDLDCAEHGCCGGHTCYVAPEEVPALAGQQPAADEEAAEQFRKGWQAGYAAAQQPAAVDGAMVERVALAIHRAMKPSNLKDSDWTSGAVLGFENGYRDTVMQAARAAIACCETNSAAQPGGSDNDR